MASEKSSQQRQTLHSFKYKRENKQALTLPLRLILKQFDFLNQHYNRLTHITLGFQYKLA